MCNPISFIKRDGQLLYLRGGDLETKRGKQTVAYCQNRDDLCGHGAIRYYFGSEAEDGTITLFSGGVDGEVTNFSSPDNFPPEIVEDIKRGAFRGIFAPPRGILRAPLYADYKAKRDALYADWQAKWDALDADYKAKLDALDADWQAKRAPLYADYKAKRDALYAETWTLFADPDNRVEAWR
jgi:hypothetical protein